MKEMHVQREPLTVCNKKQISKGKSLLKGQPSPCEPAWWECLLEE